MTEPTGTRERLLLIDGHSMAYRAFFALPSENFTTATGQTTNAIYGFFNMLLRLLENEKPTHVAVAFDEGSTTFRTEEYAEYKGGREETPEAFRDQVPLIREMLKALGVADLSEANYEADDILATLATQGAGQGMDVLVASGDRDTFQLVTDQVTVLYPVQGVTVLNRMTPAAVEGKYRVPPHRYPELAALTGETSDNLPGVPGVGPGFAAKWINQFDGLDNVIARADEIGGKKGEALRAHLPNVVRNRHLNHLLTDMDLTVAPADLTIEGGSREAVRQLCDTLEFNAIRDRLLTIVSAGGDEAPEIELTERETVSDLGGWLSRNTNRVALDVVSEPGPRGAARLIGAADSEGTGSIALDEIPVPEVVAWLGSESPKSVHGAKDAWHHLRAAGLELNGVTFDTELASYLCYPGQRTYALPEMLARLLGREVEAGDPSGQGELDLGLTDEGAEARDRAVAIDDLTELLTGELEKRNATALLTDLELPVQLSLQRMEAAGVAVDGEYLAGLEAEFGARVDDAAAEAYKVIKREVNLSSPKQLQEVLFDDLKMPKTRKTKTGYTTDAEALLELFERTQHPFLQHLLVHREQIKLRQIVETLRRAIGDDGRIHTTFQQTIAATGRLSSFDPNLQNIPIRTDEGQRIREAFVVSDGYECLLTADYSQIEMRVMAHLSGDEGLIQAFREGEDLHRFVGSRVFGVTPAEVTPAMRSKVKAMSYGLAYGLSAFGLSRQLRVDMAEARSLMEGYFERFGGVKRYLEGVVDEARRTGYTETILGRRRYLPDLNSDNRQRRELAERIALNSPIQGSAADIIKLAMIHIDERLARERLRSRMLLQVHDELVIEVAPGELTLVTAVLREEMSGAVALSVPLDVSVGVGENWRVAGH
ncbi:MAG TPA: DNA polymerase I [Actinomycetaceae bacterium]|nr:DNA polymerase I [Actinomycetaceae bacterium]